jgi:hypothetical protein
MPVTEYDAKSYMKWFGCKFAGISKSEPKIQIDSMRETIVLCRPAFAIIALRQ